MAEYLTPERLAEIRKHVASTTNWTLGNLAARDLLSEVDRLRADLATAKDRLDHLERIALPDLRREIEWHQAGKKRWRDRAKKAETSLADAAVSGSTAGDEQAVTSPWQQAVDGLNALVDAGIPLHIEPDGHIANPCGDEHIEWNRETNRWQLVMDEEGTR
ncbi:hypothetical protein [Streptomyces lavendulocolor]|uniref:hypothetical protein n=1 Tax=Streptomyces lavendulocolor TaxID=67316 RepID=UPI0033F32D74